MESSSRMANAILIVGHSYAVEDGIKIYEWKVEWMA
jgi:hypothetical protein